MLFEHQRIIIKQHCDELNINESGTCGFNFLPNTHICRFKGKCPIKHVLNCNPLKDGKRITEPEWALTLLLRLDLWNMILPPHPISSANSTSFLPGPNPNSTSSPQNICLKKCPEISNICFLFNFDEKETNSSRLN